MAKKFVSAAVFTNEIDASFLAPGVGAIGAALIGTAPMGPALVPVVVTNFTEFTQFFGDLNEDHPLGYLARAYLKNSATANVVRVLGPVGRSAAGSTVDPGYDAEAIWSITAGSGSAGAVMALLEITASHDLQITDLTGDEFFVSITGSTDAGALNEQQAGVTASFLTGSSKYVTKVLNADATKFGELGYYVRDTYDYSLKTIGGADAIYSSGTFALTDFKFGHNSGSTPWIKSQLFGGIVEYDLFRVHTLGHGEAENGRLKISIANVRPSVVPSVSDFGLFDLEVRLFGDKDKSRILAENTYANLSLDPTSNNYICRRIGDKVQVYNQTLEKVEVFGDFENLSKLIRVEVTTGSIPDAVLPWGFRGLEKADLSVLSGTDPDTGVDADVVSAVLDLPLVADLLDKETQAEAKSNIYWGMETSLSGNIRARLTKYSKMTGSDADFTLTNVSGSSLANLEYNTSNPAANLKEPGTSTSDTTLDPALAKFTIPVAFGFDGFDRRVENPLDNDTQLTAISQIGVQALRQAVDIIRDPDFIDINLLVIPGIYSDKVVEFALDAIEDRADALYIAEASGSSVDLISSEVQNRGFDSNFASIYYPDVKVLDDVNNKIVRLPASIMAAGAVAFTDRVAFPWFAPAGLNRGGLTQEVVGFTVTDVVDRLKQSERDKLQENRINPIASFPAEGIAIWGQKTLQVAASALDRVNVRRLLIFARKLIASTSKFLVFEQNDATLQTQFRNLVNPILRDIQQKRGLQTFKVVSDVTNNPAESVARNILNGTIFLVPTKSAEFINIDFVVSPEGATFDE